MSASRPWFRFYVEAVYDRKLRRLTPAQRWLWVVVLAAARKSPVPGELMLSEALPLSDEDLADMGGVPVSQVASFMGLAEQLGMVAVKGNHWVVPKWGERQYESDVSTTRVKRFRERSRNGPDTETETDTPQPPANGGLSKPSWMYETRPGPSPVAHCQHCGRLTIDCDCLARQA